METLNCLIVDDEPIAREIVQQYCENFPYLYVVGLCANAFEASAALNKYKVDLLFLDINMPMLDGLSFLKTLSNKPQVILTTAYKEFAIESYEIGVCDYLLKPFTIDRFFKAVQKATSTIQQTPKSSLATTENTPKEKPEDICLMVKTETKTYKIPYSEILYLESKGNYSVVVTTTDEHKIYIPLYKIEETLQPNYFIRTHRSFIVSKEKIRQSDAQHLLVGKTTIPIGRKYKEDVRKKL